MGHRMNGKLVLVTLLLSIGAVRPGDAQWLEAPIQTVSAAPLPADSDLKSPALAGALSFLVPFGTGSFYAGHSAHGVRHLTISAAALAAGVIANDRLSRDDDELGSILALATATAALTVNWIWGTVTAVSDARAYNRRRAASNVLGGLFIDPLPQGGPVTPGNLGLGAWLQFRF